MSYATQVNMADYTSSPDPLADMSTNFSPQKSRKSSAKVRRSLPMQGSSPKKQTFELDVGNTISPQKIRVTVEAGNENSFSMNGTSLSPTPAPSNRRRGFTTTTTTTVPLRVPDEDETRQAGTPKRGRGRPRKSVGTPVPAKKRAGTPTQKGKRKSIGDLVDGDNRDDTNLGIRRGPGRPRSGSTKGPLKSTPIRKPTGSSDKITSSRGRPKSVAREEIIQSGETSSASENQWSGQGEVADALPASPTGAGYTSAYSTTHSNTTYGGDHEDVVVAMFDPGNETPRHTGWSSSRVIEAPRASSHRRTSSDYPSPEEPSGKRPDSGESEDEMQDGDEEIDDDDEEVEDDGNGEVEDDGNGEYREFDTIMESEGFTMISLDSVPSLRKEFGSTSFQAGAVPSQTTINTIKNKNLFSTQQEEAAVYNRSFSSLPEDALEAATPGRKLQISRILSVQKSARDDSFSSIPPDILEAASPVKRTHASESSPIEDAYHERTSSRAPAESVAVAAPTIKQSPRPRNVRMDRPCDDIFSAIPSSVLDAASPDNETQARMSSPGWTAREGDILSSVSTKTAATDTSKIKKSSLPVNAHLPEGYDEAPKAIPTDKLDVGIPVADRRVLSPSNALDVPAQPSHAPGQDAPNETSLSLSHLPSSPPIVPRQYTYAAHLRQQRRVNPDSTQTPSILFSSPSLPPPPPVQPVRSQSLLAARAPSLQPKERPTLSPVARSGRALQDIVVPSSSTRSRSQSLGSPFKSPGSSPAAERCPSPAHGRLAPPLPKLDLDGQVSLHSSQQSYRSSMAPREDPFSREAPEKHPSPSPEGRHGYSLEMPRRSHLSSSRLPSTRSTKNSIRSIDAMSWQAEEEISSHQNHTSASNNITSAPDITSWDQKWAAERVAVSKKITSTHPKDVVVIDSDDKMTTFDDEGEDFDLLLETLNSSSPASAVQEHHEHPLETIERPRRSKLPSPWRQNSKRLVHGDEFAQPSSPQVVAKESAPRQASKGSALDTATVHRVEAQETDVDMDQSELSGWQIPQKSNSKPRSRSAANGDISALLGSSTGKNLPVLSKKAQRTSPRQDSSACFRPSVEISRVSKVLFGHKAREPADFAPIPPKVAFNPQARAPSPVKQRPLIGNTIGAQPIQDTGVRDESEFSPSFDGPISRPETPLYSSSPNRTNTQHQALVEPSPSVYSPKCAGSDTQSGTSDLENQGATSRASTWKESLRLRADPARTQTPPISIPTSPQKSCLRSPLKTPSANFGSGSELSPSKRNVAFVSSSPVPETKITDEAPLSATQWSKDHWRLLDSIIQSWKPENSSEKEGFGRRNSTRVISRLLGKKVTSEGMSMRLEQWHLEAVDEFRGLVNGWDEKVVAVRVFSILLGEEMREGIVPGYTPSKARSS